MSSFKGVASVTRGFATLGLVMLCTDPAFAAETQHLEKYTWILVVASFAAFGAAYGIGANDVANAFSTSVGAKSISIKQAVVLAMIFEFLGAVTLGSSVSETIRKGIADPECFADNPGLLMWGMLCVIFATGGWLILATYYEMPVSTTHSCVGAIIGMTMMSRRSGCVTWYEESDEFPFVKGVVAIVVSWVLSPFASGLCAAAIYGTTWVTVLQFKGDRPFLHAKIAFPVIVFFTVSINAAFFILKGAKGKAEELGTSGMLAKAKGGDYSEIFAVSAVVGACAGFVTMCATPYLAGRAEAAGLKVDEQRRARAAQPQDVEGQHDNEEGTELSSGPRLVASNLSAVEFNNLKKQKSAKVAAPSKVVGTSLDDNASKNPIVVTKSVSAVASDAGSSADSLAAVSTSPSKGYVHEQLNKDPHAVLGEDATVGGIHARVTRHDARTEEMFKYVQVFTAIVAAFSHGANDVANAMGPFAAIWMTWKTGGVASGKAEVGDDMYWILGIGGVGIAVGLATYGYKIMQAIGVKLTAITPARGYCIELGAAFVVIYGTTQGWPLSTTHCQVGATVGVGLFEGTSGINKPVLLRTLFGWVITLVVAGVTAAILVGPSPEPEKALYCDGF